MKRLFVIGASVLQLPAIEKAKEMGLYVGTCDMNPKAVGVPYADEFYEVSTIDQEGVYRAAKTFKADGIMTLATDMPMRSVAYACSKLGLPGINYETAVKATDKAEMIKAFEVAGVEHPEFFVLKAGESIDTLPKNLKYPVISKPTDNAGSHGVMLVHNEDELEQALAYSAKNGRHGDVIIEEYMQGPEVSVEVIVYQGIPHVLQITDKLTTGAPHFVEMGHSQPSQLTKELKEKIEDLASRACLAVGIENGPAHVEIICTADGPKMVELGARMGGDCITTHLVPLSTGIDMVAATIHIALGEKPDIQAKFNRGSAIRYLKTRTGTITEINGIEEAKNIKGIRQVTLTKKIGDVLGDIDSSNSRIGFVIAQEDTPQKAIDTCVNSINKINVIVKEK